MKIILVIFILSSGGGGRLDSPAAPLKSIQYVATEVGSWKLSVLAGRPPVVVETFHASVSDLVSRASDDVENEFAEELVRGYVIEAEVSESSISRALESKGLNGTVLRSDCGAYYWAPDPAQSSERIGLVIDR